MPRNPKRNVMRALKINEISGVDNPAQEGARMVIMKRADDGNVLKGAALARRLNRLVDGHVSDAMTRAEVVAGAASTAGIELSTMNQILSSSINRPPDTRLSGIARYFGVAVSGLETLADRDAGVTKAMGDLADLLTSEEEGHQHGINVRVYDGELSVAVSYASGPDDEGGHCHPIARNAEGQYELGTVEGHTHTIDQEAMSRAVLALVTKDSTVGKGDETMPDNPEKAEGREPTVEDLQKQLDKANVIIALSAVEKAHFDALDGDQAKDAFLAKSGDERKADIEAVEKAKQDPIQWSTRRRMEPNSASPTIPRP